MYLMKFMLAILISISLFSCGSTQEQTVEPDIVPAQEGKIYPDSTLAAMQQLLKNYYAVKDALVKSDAAEAKMNAALLSKSVINVSIVSLKVNDPTIYATAAESLHIIQTSSETLAQTNSLQTQREVFETLSDHIYDLVRTTKPSGIAAYKQYCPMAFNDKGAYWLSDTSHIQNPYFGKKMLICGEVQETLRYK